ncbi:CcmD family protein [Mucilaginibacter aquatilis]|uniref:CcmD family protein n=1 Tax=Mucilaginibacter aquatilis TaxID=1517760 RepID=A0A6I4I8Y1_9SPHI|nr:CcmD family protein [Mucilaginibacter aquatilis]MVN91690.1 CcmD family protein [Mucilaginibacter aquatilis]
MKKLTCLAVLLMGYLGAFAQDVEMADTMRSEGKIYVVIGTIVIVFVGLALYLFSMDRRLNRIEKHKD